jgi:bacterial leucyl aminopeptidase
VPLTTKRRSVVFFDIGGTLGQPRLSGQPPRLTGIDVYPHMPGVLEGLRSRRIALGIISNTGAETARSMRQHLEHAGIYGFFNSRLLVFSSVVGLEKDSPAIFELAARRARRASDPATCIFVGEDNLERSYALAAGWRVLSDPRLVAAAVDGEVAAVRSRHDSGPDL